MSDRPALPPGVRAIQDELARHEFADLDEVQAFLERRMAEYNAAPQAELGELSPMQMRDLLAGDWEAAGPLRLNPALGGEDFAAAPFVIAARRLLTLAAADRGVPATQAAGNLTRKTVAELMDAAPWPGRMVDDTRAVSKVINEPDFMPVHVVRVVLELAGLLRRRVKAFRTTTAGRALLHPALTLEGEIERERREWDALGGEGDDAYFRRTAQAIAFLDLDLRVLRPLGWFGLLEVRERRSEEPVAPWRDFRTTPLLARFVTFPPELVARARAALG